MGWAIYNEGDKIKGLAYLEKAIGLDAHNINILNDLSVAYLGMPDLKNAKKYNKLALKVDSLVFVKNIDGIDLYVAWVKSTISSWQTPPHLQCYNCADDKGSGVTV